MPTITFKVPGKRPRGHKITLSERTGRVAWLTIGDRKVKFVLQQSRLGKEADTLTHYASGMVFGRLNDVKVRYMVAKGHHAKLTDREAAEMLVATKIDQIGAAKVLEVLDASETINH
ncbi:hypothetical protein [Bradyrhizobium erythrophlei]|uniref:Uncharacterized protein n=1 Tax=Bradyrhizobium erythrophlei TaxID=1437360 RepID=A0A1M5NHZ8_9BRAD|nr:hypothetical protein [Bradyrhizobium erythrophlei]SHG89112.1 hypothetical protein SAMN05443248_3003 [Bradyrhizobium erythrophlei]